MYEPVTGKLITWASDGILLGSSESQGAGPTVKLRVDYGHSCTKAKLPHGVSRCGCQSETSHILSPFVSSIERDQIMSAKSMWR